MLDEKIKKTNLLNDMEKQEVLIKLSDIMFEDNEFINLDKILELPSEGNS